MKKALSVAVRALEALGKSIGVVMAAAAAVIIIALLFYAIPAIPPI